MTSLQFLSHIIEAYGLYGVFFLVILEGDITLLNTKAEVFAPFVRRVATRVFQNFWISLKRDLVASALATTEHVEAEAVMNPAGEMVGFEIHKRSARIARSMSGVCSFGVARTTSGSSPPSVRAMCTV